MLEQARAKVESEALTEGRKAPTQQLCNLSLRPCLHQEALPAKLLQVPLRCERPPLCCGSNFTSSGWIWSSPAVSSQPRAAEGTPTPSASCCSPFTSSCLPRARFVFLQHTDYNRDMCLARSEVATAVCCKTFWRQKQINVSQNRDFVSRGMNFLALLSTDARSLVNSVRCTCISLSLTSSVLTALQQRTCPSMRRRLHLLRHLHRAHLKCAWVGQAHVPKGMAVCRSSLWTFLRLHRSPPAGLVARQPALYL